jgi:hypothetical protein
MTPQSTWCARYRETDEAEARDVTEEVAREIVDTSGPLTGLARDFVERVGHLLPVDFDRD